MSIRPLPRPTNVLLAQPWWSYRAPTMPARTGCAHLTLWNALHAGDTPGHLAIVSETDTGLSIINGADHIWAELTTRYGHPLTLIEHVLPGTTFDGAEHLHECWVDQGTLRWRAIWPTPPTNPEHDLYEAWMNEHGPGLLNLARTTR
ncbi:hypothetical protein [Nonomuraea sp. SYSU D8015]|uniref:hypothetical protein n=1 Tax=Nonomuraea sp. SYSU D8015 TaxID=2593644 RepID=UPI0016602F42|nr:hypothetical protein [Nonomuraea sp. SYSU D8015]